MQFFNLNSKKRYNQKSLKNKIGLNILVVFSVLLLLVAFNIFSFLNSVFLGVFGLTTYIIFVALIVFGAMMYLDREIELSKKDAILLFGWLFVFACILHLSTTQGYINQSFSKYIQTVYGVKTAFGGVLLALFVYVLNFFTHTIASYVLLSVGLIVLSALISQRIYEFVKSGNKLTKQTERKRMSEKVAPSDSNNNQIEKPEELQANSEISKGVKHNQSQKPQTQNKKELQADNSSNEVFVSDEEFADEFSAPSQEQLRQQKAAVKLGLVKEQKPIKVDASSKNENMKETAYNQDNSDYLSKRPRKFVHDIITEPRKKQTIIEEGKELTETDKKNLDFLRSTTSGLSKTKYEFNKENVLEEKIVEEPEEIYEESEIESGFELDDYLTSQIYKPNSNNNQNNQHNEKQHGINKRSAMFSENNELIVSDESTTINDFNSQPQNISESQFTQSYNSGQTPENKIEISSSNTSAGLGPTQNIKKKKQKYIKPPLELLKVYESDDSELDNDFEEKAKMLEDTLASFKINASVVSVTKGPSFTRFEMQMAHGISVKRVTSYIDDIAMVLESQGAVRVEIPIPGKNAFGVEVPNERRSAVGLKDVIESYSFEGSKSKLTFALGKDITGESKVARLDKMPHLLVAGATGSGKSVCLNSMLISLLYKASPDDLKMILVDPKRVEFSLYNGLPHLLVPNVITDPEKAVDALNWTIDEMERRFIRFSKHKIRNIEEYNSLENVKAGIEDKIPYILLVIDELADLMAINKKDIEEKIRRIAQKSRAAGIHLVLATQRPSVDVITGVIKSNLPSRIAFAVSSFVDSKTILDEGGAEKLLGKGDMLYSPIEMSDSVRIQGAFVSNDEVENIVEFIKENNPADFDEEIEDEMFNKKQHGFDKNSNHEEYDPLFKDAVRFVIKRGSVSISMVQRGFGIGFNRAGRIVDQMELAGFVSPPDNSRARELYITQQEFEERFGEDL